MSDRAGMGADSEGDRRRFRGRVCCVLAVLLLPCVIGLVVLQVDYLHQALCSATTDVAAGEPVPVEVRAPSYCRVLLDRDERGGAVQKGDLLVCHAPELACGASVACPVLPDLVLLGVIEAGLLLGAIGGCRRRAAPKPPNPGPER